MGITVTTNLVPCHLVKSLQLIWRSGNCRRNLQVPYIQVICTDFYTMLSDTLIMIESTWWFAYVLMKYLASGHQQPSWWLKPGITLLWHHNGRDGVSNHQPRNCLLNHSFRGRSKKTSKLCITGLRVGNSPVTGESPAQKASNAENVSIWWRHHDEVYQHVSCNLPSLATEAIHYIWYKGLQLI